MVFPFCLSLDSGSVFYLLVPADHHGVGLLPDHIIIYSNLALIFVLDPTLHTQTQTLELATVAYSTFFGRWRSEACWVVLVVVSSWIPKSGQLPRIAFEILLLL